MINMKNIFLLALATGMLVSCSKVDLDDPVISNFSAEPTTLPKRDSLTFQIDASGDYITFYDGKSTLDLSDKDMPYTHKAGRLRFRVTPPADTVWAKLAVVNVYDSENIKTKIDSIQLILLDE